MKTYVQFFQMSLGQWPDFKPESKCLIEVCGDRGIIRIDGRLSTENIKHIAQEECKKRKYEAWQIMKGENLSNAKPTGEMIKVQYD